MLWFRVFQVSVYTILWFPVFQVSVYTMLWFPVFQVSVYTREFITRKDRHGTMVALRNVAVKMSTWDTTLAHRGETT